MSLNASLAEFCKQSNQYYSSNYRRDIYFLDPQLIAEMEERSLLEVGLKHETPQSY
jgi:hypothetical protein